jgi:nucleotide-binding universal stress UspA family protein
MYQNILVAIDGSPTSDLALHEALRIAKDGSHVRAITVIVDPLAGYGTPDFSYDHESVHAACIKHGNEVLRKAENDAKHLSSITLETQLIDLAPSAMPDVAPAILQASKDYHADLIVIGRHGKSGVKRFFLGSVADHVIRHSLIPVLIVRGLTHDHKSS